LDWQFHLVVVIARGFAVGPHYLVLTLTSPGAWGAHLVDAVDAANPCARSPRAGTVVVIIRAHAADRFAREIIAILTVSAARSRRLMGKPFGGSV